MSLDRSSRMRILSIAAGLLLVLQPALCTLKDPVAYAQDLRDNREAAIAADSLLGKITPLYTGYASLNSAVPVKVLVNCHYGPVPVNGTASNSASAKQYIDDIAYIVADGYQPVVEKQEKGTYNQSWSVGITWGGMCLIVDGMPSCNYTFNAISRASGLAQITRVPKGGSVEFVSCGVYMDNAIVTSETCFQDDSTTIVPITVPFAEQSVSKISFISTYRDSSPDGPPGEYSLMYACQFDWNSALIFNPLGNFAGLDPRITAVVPNHQNGGFGPKGNGGNEGRRLLRQIGRSPTE